MRMTPYSVYWTETPVLNEGFYIAEGIQQYFIKLPYSALDVRESPDWKLIDGFDCDNCVKNTPVLCPFMNDGRTNKGNCK